MALQKSEFDSMGSYHFDGNELTEKFSFYRIRIIDETTTSFPKGKEAEYNDAFIQ